MEEPEKTTTKEEEEEEWAERRAREEDEIEANRFACGGWNCAGSHCPR